jgi:hypothetical protein
MGNLHRPEQLLLFTRIEVLLDLLKKFQVESVAMKISTPLEFNKLIPFFYIQWTIFPPSPITSTPCTSTFTLWPRCIC